MQFYFNFQITLIHFFTLTTSLISTKKISIPGDIILGGIFPIHQKGEFIITTTNNIRSTFHLMLYNDIEIMPLIVNKCL